MKQHDITKLCADSLRAFALNNHGIKLKPSHAHELVAAFLGYQSRAALLADTKFSINNLSQAEFILVNPSENLVDLRYKDLQDLPPNFPPSYILAEGFYPTLLAEKWILEKVWPTFHDLAVHLAEERLHERWKMWGIDPKAIKMEMDVDIEHKEDKVLLTVVAGNHTSDGEHLRDSKYVITLPRIAANLGYGKPKVEESLYAGMARKWSDEELLKRYPTIPAGVV